MHRKEGRPPSSVSTTDTTSLHTIPTKPATNNQQPTTKTKNIDAFYTPCEYITACVLCRKTLPVPRVGSETTTDSITTVSLPRSSTLSLSLSFFAVPPVPHASEVGLDGTKERANDETDQLEADTVRYDGQNRRSGRPTTQKKRLVKQKKHSRHIPTDTYGTRTVRKKRHKSKLRREPRGPEHATTRRTLGKTDDRVKKHRYLTEMSTPTTKKTRNDSQEIRGLL